MGMTIGLLIISNIFMTYAWYGHLKDFGTKPLIFVVFFSWVVAFFEYCFQVPANRIGYRYFTVYQLKLVQEVITLSIFTVFATFYFGIRPTLNFLWAGLCLLGAVFFIFRDLPKT